MVAIRGGPKTSAWRSTRSTQIHLPLDSLITIQADPSASGHDTVQLVQVGQGGDVVRLQPERFLVAGGGLAVFSVQVQYRPPDWCDCEDPGKGSGIKDARD
jgi:hypothetical protein